jgi:hypothetical protein
MILWLVFGILGMNLWSGKFHYCSDPSFPGWNLTDAETGFIGHKSGCNGTYVDIASGVTRDRQWLNRPYGYDNIFQALRTLFEVSSLDAWTDISHASADAYEVDHQPRMENGPSGYVFYAIFVVLSAFFFMQLFVGVVYDNFNRLKSEQDGSILLSDAQKKWIKHQKLAFRAVSGYEVDTDKYGPLRMRCFRLTQSAKFEYAIMTCILGNALTMATTHYNEPSSVTTFVVVSDYCFTVIFLAEAIIKLLGFGITIYFMENWNRFDFTIVFFSLVDKGIEWSGSTFFAEVPIGRTILRMLRVARVARMVRLVKKAKSLRALFNTFMLSIPSMANVSALLLLSLYIFAVLAMDLFGTIKVRGAPYPPYPPLTPHTHHLIRQPGQFVNDHANFNSFFASIITLFRVVTGDNWRGVMYDASVTSDCNTTRPDYDGERLYTCGDAVTAQIFFPLAFVVMNFCFLNLFISVILENFFEAGDDDDDAHDANVGVDNGDVTVDDVDDFKKVWSKFDPWASQ